LEVLLLLADLLNCCIGPVYDVVGNDME
jgi:hypothetical protein